MSIQECIRQDFSGRKRFHFIAIGGSAMHNLAIALHRKGEHVSGSDDEIFDPARERLSRYGLLPDMMGWFPDKITPELDAVILGMHARADNPELIKAKSLDIKIYSYPEFLYEQSRYKTRIVVGGSHGKTTITAMIIHVLHECRVDCDYMVGAQLEGFDVMVRLTPEAGIMVIEGDEYLTSTIDRRPKFHHYHPNVAIISGIAWDHINVFPTFENYVEQFREFVRLIEPGGTLIYNADDLEVCKVADIFGKTRALPYLVPEHEVRDGVTYLRTPDGEIPLRVFGKHNIANLDAARLACRCVGISDADFFAAIGSFKGASKRLELIAEDNDFAVFRDFAHAPSKLVATIAAVKTQFPNRKLVACLELHTFSSLSETFLSHYKNSMNEADIAIVYYNPQALKHKKMPPLTPQIVSKHFDRPDLSVFTDSEQLIIHLQELKKQSTVFLMMSSGNFNGLDLSKL
ncbi:MAG: Mur ligase domain-containing protein [Bacteroidales bacterium]|jgi:UDP-N-acetylmuramate: L-alanyl-gamma-D-glutamyl-meso-diaminopimelate ligase|nr:Mur ligase domain-containing protein [Bacteroidales bacterium]